MKTIILCWMVLFSLTWGSLLSAQESNSLIGASDYALILNPYVSKQVAESLEMSTWMENYTADGCVLTTASDGALICLIYNSCHPDQSILCAVRFNARVGLRLEDVADLVVLRTLGQGSSLNSEGDHMFQLFNRD